MCIRDRSEVGIFKTKAFLMAKFAMKYLGDVSLMIRMQVSRDRLKGTLDINQGSYVNTTLQRYSVDSRSVSTSGTGKPLDVNSKQLYQRIVGIPIDISTCTRWDAA